MRTTRISAILVLALGLMAWSAEPAIATPMGSAFSYQGRLIDANEPADGLYDLQLKLYDSPAGGTQVGSTLDANEVDVNDGYFALLLDFGSAAAIFNGSARWLEIGVREGALDDPNVYIALVPRQELTPTPYALYAANAPGGAVADNDWKVTGTNMFSMPVGNVGIGTTTPSFKLTLDNDGGIIAKGTQTSGANLPVSGAGTRLIWYPKKAAFRAGYVAGAHWNDANVGLRSFAAGRSTTASGDNSTAVGDQTTASGESSTARGYRTNASGYGSTTMGWGTTASGGGSTAMGYHTTAGGDNSTAMGDQTTASGYGSTARGYRTTASGYGSTAMGWDTTASGDNSTAMGRSTSAYAYTSLAIGRYNVGGGSAGSWVATDPVFEIGVGSSAAAKANAVTVLKNGKVGIGTTSPGAKLQVAGDIKSESVISFGDASSTKWTIGPQIADNGYVMYANGAAGYVLVLNRTSGNVGIGTTNPQGKLDVNGSIYQRGGVLHADYVFEPSYQLESIEQHSESMWQNKHLPAIPKMDVDENGRQVIEVGAHRKGIVEELEKAHIYIEQLHQRIKELEQKDTEISSLKQCNEKMEARLAAMESLVAELTLTQEGGK